MEMEFDCLSRIPTMEEQVGFIRDGDVESAALFVKLYHRRFAFLNGLYVGQRSFRPSAIHMAKAGKRWTWDPLPGAGSDHLTYLRWQIDPGAIVSEPEDPDEVETLLRYAEKYGLRVAMPPDRFSSFRNPGIAAFLVLHHYFPGPIKWLPEQLEFGAGGGVTARSKS